MNKLELKKMCVHCTYKAMAEFLYNLPEIKDKETFPMQFIVLELVRNKTVIFRVMLYGCKLRTLLKNVKDNIFDMFTLLLTDKDSLTYVIRAVTQEEFNFIQNDELEHPKCKCQQKNQKIGFFESIKARFNKEIK